MPVIWDYHVILYYDDKVWDFDSTLSFPCDVARYIQDTMHPETALRDELRRYPWICRESLTGRMYRLVAGDVFSQTFASDRRHMLRDNGEYISPPPPWPMIQNDGVFPFLNWKADTQNGRIIWICSLI